MVTEALVYEALSGVADPEIPAVSVLDLGIIEEVKVVGDDVEVTCLPTFVGCPALDVIREDIETALTSIGAHGTVKFIYKPPWTTDRITDEGKRKLEEYGLAPPGPRPHLALTVLSPGRCPYCGSSETVVESPFGPTACRATCYCNACRNPYEKFKSV
ncbi:MAG: 1,2-phenylacetyl-CoA epoxidase subunit PaaD [Actinomycetota bacterium]